MYTKDNKNLKGFVDADWRSSNIDRKTYTGFCFKFSGAVKSYECKKTTNCSIDKHRK